jgi:hypothetical protein
VFKKFLHGLAFGAGFALSFLVIGWFAIRLLVPTYKTTATIPIESASVPRVGDEAARPFNELPIEQQIANASVIAVLRYEPATDGKKKAVFVEFLKKDPNATFHYNVGDEYSESSYYPVQGTSRGDGEVAFFTGSPARTRMTMSYSGSRIGALGDMPLDLLREKCQAR